eukprot:gene9887-12547_t
MPLLTRADYIIGDLCVRYLAPDDRPEAWGLSILPASLREEAVTPREQVDTPAVRGLPAPWNTIRAWEVDSLVHVHIAGEAYPGGYAQGRTLRNSASTQSLAVRAHTRETRDGITILRTTLIAACGLVCVHELIADEATGFLQIQTTAENPTDRPITLEFLSAFSLG